jgi:hypothetical protein
MANVGIGGSVGLGGINRVDDVRKVQILLNNVRKEWGGPDPKLVEDGACGPLTRGAIAAFQLNQLGTIFNPDSRVDPGGGTLRRLNHIAGSSETPNQSMFVSAEPVVHFRQPTNMVCWAAAGTMLVAARDKVFTTIEMVMNTADANDPGYAYLAMYQANIGLPPQDVGRYTRSIRLNVGPAISFTVGGWASLIRSKGATGVVALTPFLHIRVITQMTGDGTVFGTRMLVHDPDKAAPYSEVFLTFAQRYEAAAGNPGSGYHQIWHR